MIGYLSCLSIRRANQSMTEAVIGNKTAVTHISQERGLFHILSVGQFSCFVYEPTEMFLFLF
jgi:hypothetical protein